ncbi:hypothetical protein I4F81_011194 [Pyropia yezoensis]|uniref:Uncharacterized protein n=1 Tax=Pyropia yezoensis TaxID=2788 RepID=A0ACC3CEL7_PYRYE|nr:hypothetical protein I4F81_011194 [Neopyropia yezoensis]
MQSIYPPAVAVAWMEYHARLGVDRLFLYSNVANSTAVAAAVAAAPRGVRDAIEVVHWPWPQAEVAGTNLFLAAARGRCRWVLLFDVDEWLLLPPMLRALSALNASTGVSAFTVPSVMMGSGGQVADAHRPYPDVYTHRLVDAVAPCKALARTTDTFPLTHTHTLEMRVTRWEEEVAKRSAGRAAENVDTWWYPNVARAGVALPANASAADRRAAHLSLVGQAGWGEMRDAWRAVMRRPWRPPVVVAADADAAGLADWVDAPSLIPRANPLVRAT